jgi:hypothetical protein
MSFDQSAGLVILAMLSRSSSPEEFCLVAFASIFVEAARPIVDRGASDARTQRSEWSDLAASAAFRMNLTLCRGVAVLVLAVGALFMPGDLGGSTDDRTSVPARGQAHHRRWLKRPWGARPRRSSLSHGLGCGPWSRSSMISCRMAAGA